ncbi:MAG: hypothetical protein QF578_25345 [Alphaproteobacteria bacterium]|jgi:hypothetical protein|nr:hypothetical protein [Alphaproteobacteria bacterium]MDP6815763.1 hypothetical protein [Alphaproteobacteria bacterium]
MADIANTEAVAEDSAEDAPAESAAANHAFDMVLEERDRDSLHVLPLAIVPLQTAGLSRAKMIKDSHLRSVVELFSDGSSGSGRVDLEQLPLCYDETDELKADIEILSRLALLHSYDVYSLRIELRHLGIKINDVASLQLSDRKSRELTDYMTEFTRPLIQQIYGGTDAQIDDMEQLLAMFKNPNRNEAITNLRMIADKLGIGLTEVPVFLEEYGDVFLSLAYYQDALDQVIPRVSSFLEEMEDILGNHQVRQIPRFDDTCNLLQQRFNDITSSITGRFESFDRNSKRLWDDINAETFQAMKDMVVAHYTTVGGVLCGLFVKIDAWDEKFADGRGGPIAKADFIMSEMRQGMNQIFEIEQSAPRMSNI